MPVRECCVLCETMDQGLSLHGPQWNHSSAVMAQEQHWGLTKGWCPSAWGSVSLVLHLLLEGCRSLLDERADEEVLGDQQRPDRKLLCPGQTWKLWDKIVPRNTGFPSFLPGICRWDCLICTFVCSFNKANLYWAISYGQAFCHSVCWRCSRVYLTGEHLSWLSLL